MSDLQEVKTIFKDWLSEVQKDLKRRGSFWIPTLITDPLSARTVVLRSLEYISNGNERVPRFIVHTDIRSNKWKQLEANPHCCLHFYCPKRKWQMRVKCQAELSFQGPDATIEWKRLSSASQKIYSLKNPPGIIVEDPEKAYGFNESSQGFENFGVINLVVLGMESLQLERVNGPNYHQRAYWNIQDGTFNFLAP